MKKLAILFLFCSLSTLAQTVDFSQFYPIDRGHSYVEFSIPYMGYAKAKGRFADFSGMVRFDEKKPENTSITLAIKVESIDTDLDFRDNDLRSDNWSDAKKFPMITFVSKSVRKGKNEGLLVIGNLTIKGVTREVTLDLQKPLGPMKDIRQDLQVIFTGTAKLDRTEYGVEGKNWSGIKEGMTAVGNEVTIEFTILGKQVLLPNFTNRVSNPESFTGKVYKSIKDTGVDQGVQTFKSLRASDNVDRNVLSTVGNQLLLEGNQKAAISLFETNRNEFPDAPEVYYDLARAYGISGDLAKAKMSFEESVKKNPDYSWSAEILRHFK